MILIIDTNCQKDSLGYFEFVLPLFAIAKAYDEIEIKHYSEVVLNKIEKYEKIIFSGTPLKDNQYLHDLERFEWIKNRNKPILGICAGMQIIGRTFGAELVSCTEIGMVKINTKKENFLFSGNFNAYEIHNFSLKNSKNFIGLAESANCLQAIKLVDKPFYGVLFHPEVRNPEILNNFLSLNEGEL